MIGAAAALLVLAIVGMLRLEISFDNLEWFPDDMPAKVASQLIDARFGGTVGLEVLVDTGRPNGLHDPELLRALDRIRQTAEGLPVDDLRTGRSLSLVDIVKEIHQALNEGRPEARVVPSDRALVSQELILFENSGSDDLSDVVDTEFAVGRFTLRVPMADATNYVPLIGSVEGILERELPDGVDFRLTGIMSIMGRTLIASIETMFRSYGIALAVITPLMMLLLGSLRLGLIAMIPNLLPIVLTLGLMGWTGQPLEMFSLLIGSIALGLAVDDTIHFMHGFRRRYAATGDVDQAVHDTLSTTGQALLFTSIVLCGGFLIYLFSELNNLTRLRGVHRVLRRDGLRRRPAPGARPDEGRDALQQPRRADRRSELGLTSPVPGPRSRASRAPRRDPRDARSAGRPGRRPRRRGAPGTPRSGTRHPRRPSRRSGDPSRRSRSRRRRGRAGALLR